MDQAEFRNRLGRLLAQRTGLVLSPRVLSFLEQFSEERMRHLGLRRHADYFDLVAGEVEFQLMVNRATNCETYFYRDRPQCEAIRQVLIQSGSRLKRPLRVWSAGCSSGEEPFTLAMLAAEGGVQVEILGTDLNSEALAVARQARYPEWSLRHVPEAVRERYFWRHGSHYQCRPEIHSQVTFEYHNLLAPQWSRVLDRMGHWDLILCRNLFIYQSSATVQSVARRLVLALRPEGWLFVSAAERLDTATVGAQVEVLAGTIGYRPTSKATTPRPLDKNPAHRPTAAPVSAASGSEVGTTQLHDSFKEPIAESSVSLPGEPGLPKGEGRLEEGIQLLEAGQPQEALEAFEEALESGALNHELHYWLALAYRRLNWSDRYEISLRRALFLSPNFWPAAFLLAGRQEERGRITEALTFYRQILELLEEQSNGSDRSRNGRLKGILRYGNEVATICREKVDRLKRK